MTQTLYRRFGIGRKSLPGNERRPARHQAVPVLGAELECRTLLSVVSVTAAVSQAILRQINPRNQPHSVQVAVIRPVTLAGYVTVTPGLTPVVTPTVTFRVVDANGRHMPFGTITPQLVPATTPGQPDQFFFSKRFGLNLSRLPGHATRNYIVDVVAKLPQTASAGTISIPVSTISLRR